MDRSMAADIRGRQGEGIEKGMGHCMELASALSRVENKKCNQYLSIQLEMGNEKGESSMLLIFLGP